MMLLMQVAFLIIFWKSLTRFLSFNRWNTRSYCPRMIRLRLTHLTSQHCEQSEWIKVIYENSDFQDRLVIWCYVQPTGSNDHTWAFTVGQALLSALYAFKKFALQSNSMSLFCYYSHFTEEAADKQRMRILGVMDTDGLFCVNCEAPKHLGKHYSRYVCVGISGCCEWTFELVNWEEHITLPNVDGPHPIH